MRENESDPPTLCDIHKCSCTHAYDNRNDYTETVKDIGNIGNVHVYRNSTESTRMSRALYHTGKVSGAYADSGVEVSVVVKKQG